jgi:hypothetical protein
MLASIKTTWTHAWKCSQLPNGENLMTEPTRSRAVFSTEDFGLMKEAVLHYLKAIQDKPESTKFSNLYHRLGRLG